MPTYEYRCKKCNKVFSENMSISEFEKKKTHTCPHCKSRSVQRIYSGFSAVTSKKS
jgi:putative FmdB family regulatory protein